MKYAVKMVSCSVMYIPSFIKTGASVETILRFFLSNLGRCNIGIFDRGDL
jgi:hypothetical protein